MNPTNKPLTAEEIKTFVRSQIPELKHIINSVSQLRDIVETVLIKYAQSSQEQPQGSELPSEVLIPLNDAVALAQWRCSEHGLDTDAMTLVEEYNSFLQLQSKQKGETNE